MHAAIWIHFEKPVAKWKKTDRKGYMLFDYVKYPG